MQRPLRILVATLLIVFVAVFQTPLVGGDDLVPNGGRGWCPNDHGGGGITVLPGNSQATFHYAPGENVCIQLPPCMRDSVIVGEVDDHWTSIASLVDGKLVMRGADLQRVFRAGVEEFRLFVVNAQMQWLLFVVSFDSVGNVTVTVYGAPTAP